MSWSWKASSASIHEVLLLLRLGDQLGEQLGARGRACGRSSPPRRRSSAGSSRARSRELRVGVGHHLDRPLGEPAEPGRLEAERAALLDRAAHDRGAGRSRAPRSTGTTPSAIRNDAPRGVVGDDPHRARRRGVVVVARARELLRERRSAARRSRSRTPSRRPAGSPPSARARGRCRCCAAAASVERAVLVQLVGHEDVVPVLEVAVGVVARALVGARRTPRRGRGTSPSRARTARWGPPARSSPSAGSRTIRSSGTPLLSQISIASVSGPSPSSSSPPKTVTQIRSGSSPKTSSESSQPHAIALLLEVVAEARSCRASRRR